MFGLVLCDKIAKNGIKEDKKDRLVANRHYAGYPGRLSVVFFLRISNHYQINNIKLPSTICDFCYILMVMVAGGNDAAKAEMAVKGHIRLLQAILMHCKYGICDRRCL